MNIVSTYVKENMTGVDLSSALISGLISKLNQMEEAVSSLTLYNFDQVKGKVYSLYNVFCDELHECIEQETLDLDTQLALFDLGFKVLIKLGF